MAAAPRPSKAASISVSVFFLLRLLDLPDWRFAYADPNARSASSDDEEELLLLNEKMLLRLLVRRLRRFSDDAVKNELKPLPTVFRAGLEISTKDSSEEDAFLGFLPLEDALRLLLLWRDSYSDTAAVPTATPRAAFLRAACR